MTGTNEHSAARAAAYESARPDVQALVPAGTRRLLDVGCCTGALGAALKARSSETAITGIEIDADYARIAQERLDRVVVGDVMTAADRDDLGSFDCIVCADVLEHLADPDLALEALLAHAEPGATVIVSLPNVRYWETFWALGRHGRWPRRPSGLFDETHLRWFTYGDGFDLLHGAGLAVEHVEPRLLRRDGRFWPGWIAKILGGVPFVRTLLTLQYLYVGRTPD